MLRNTCLRSRARQRSWYAETVRALKPNGDEMDWIRRKLEVLESRSARRLLIFSAVLTIAIVLISFAGTFCTSMINEIFLL